MQMVKNIFVALLVAWFALLVFMPKTQLYYKAEEELAKKNIVINEKGIDEGIFSLVLEEPSVYVKGIKVATLESINFFTLLFYTSTDLKNLLMDDVFKASMPTDIEKVNLTHVLWSPKEIKIQATGLFGGANGTIDLGERVVHLDFNETKEIEMLKPKLKQNEEGWYYEASF